MAVALASESQHRRPRTFSPSLWGDYFLNHSPCTPSQLLSMKETADAMKEEVRQTILEAAASNDLIRKLELVDTLQLRHVYDVKDAGSDDLYVTSLRFYLLRKHGYSVSSDVFLKHRGEQGNVSSDDVNCLLTLYDAAHLSTHGERILDSIIAFNKSRLKLLNKTSLEPCLAEQVRMTVQTPRFRRVERVESRRYISAYEKRATRDDAVLKFAKLDYSILQALYCQELKELTMWWTEFRTQADTSSYARDRMVEMHFWMMGVFFEPQHSYSRKMLTQLFMIVSVLDDLYDNYYTIEQYYKDM